jgi:hypothetical protein
MTHTEEDIGKIVDYETSNGMLKHERIVLVYCQICSAQFIGPIREAGGFLGAHELFHNWEFSAMIQSEKGGLIP